MSRNILSIGKKNYNNNQVASEFDKAILPDKMPVLFKKSFSRVVLIQIINIIYDEINYKNIPQDSLLSMFKESLIDEYIKKIATVNTEEWSYFRCKNYETKLMHEFIKKLSVSFCNNYTKVVEIFDIHRSDSDNYKPGINKVICFAAISELLTEEEGDDYNFQDQKKLLINEYVNISSFFVDQAYTNFINGLLNSVFDKINESSAILLPDFDSNISQLTMQ